MITVLVKQTPIGDMKNLPGDYVPNALLWWGGLPVLHALDGTARLVYSQVMLAYSIEDAISTKKRDKFKARLIECSACGLRGIECLSGFSLAAAPIEALVKFKL